MEGLFTECDWSDWLQGICLRLRQAMLAHREGARVVAGAGFGRAVVLARLVDMIIRNLMAAGFSLRLASITCTTTLSYVYGFVIEEQAAPNANTASNTDTSDKSILAAVFHEKRANDYTSDIDFLAGLEMILDGANHKITNQMNHSP